VAERTPAINQAAILAGEAENVVVAVVFCPLHRLDAAVIPSPRHAIRVCRQCCLRRFVTCLMTVLTSVPFGVRAGRRMAAIGMPLAI